MSQTEEEIKEEKEQKGSDFSRLQLNTILKKLKLHRT